MQTLTDVTPSDLTIPELADGITKLSGQIAAGQARLIAFIAEFDRRDGWAGHGLLSCAHWLSWKVGLGLNAAREHVRVARALDTLPITAGAFAAGRLSWSQVRAITRAASRDDEETYVNVARHATAAQLERIVRGVRRARLNAEADADPGLAAYKMRATRRYDPDGIRVLTIRYGAQDAPIIDAAISRVCRHQPPPEGGRRRFRGNADAVGWDRGDRGG
jgi:hypothetical protein